MARKITSVTWSATGLPAGLTINASTGMITGTPDVQPPATFTPTIKVVTNYGTDSKKITINITVPEEWLPVINPNQIATFIANQTGSYPVTGKNVTLD